MPLFTTEPTKSKPLGPPAPAVHDSNTLARAVQGLKRELEEERFRTWVNLETINSMYLDDPSTDPTNAPARLGRAMTASEFENKLAKLNPKLRFLHPGLSLNPGKKVLAIERPCGSLEKLFPYESGIMPERSIMSRKIMDVPDSRLIGKTPTGAMFHIDRRDLPSHEMTRTGVEFDPSVPLPGFRRVSVPWREEVRGWRTVLLRLVALRLIYPEEVERVFGPDNTPEWKGSTGKGRKERPW